MDQQRKKWEEDALIRFLVSDEQGQAQGQEAPPGGSKTITAQTRDGRTYQIPADAIQPVDQGQGQPAAESLPYQATGVVPAAAERIAQRPMPEAQPAPEQPATEGAAQIALPTAVPTRKSIDWNQYSNLEQELAAAQRPVEPKKPGFGRKFAAALADFGAGHFNAGANQRGLRDRYADYNAHTQREGESTAKTNLEEFRAKAGLEGSEFSSQFESFNGQLALARAQREMANEPDTPEGRLKVIAKLKQQYSQNGREWPWTTGDEDRFVMGGQSGFNANQKQDADPAKVIKQRKSEIAAMEEAGAPLNPQQKDIYLKLGREGLQALITRTEMPNPGHTLSEGELWRDVATKEAGRPLTAEEIATRRIIQPGQLSKDQRQAKRTADSEKAEKLAAAKSRYTRQIKTAVDQGTKDRLANEYASAQQEAVNAAEDKYDEADLPYTHFDVRAAGSPAAIPSPGGNQRSAPRQPAPAGKGKQYGASLSQGDRVTVGKEAMEVVEVRRNPQTGEEAYKLKNGKWVRQSQLQPVQK